MDFYVNDVTIPLLLIMGLNELFGTDPVTQGIIIATIGLILWILSNTWLGLRTAVKDLVTAHQALSQEGLNGGMAHPNSVIRLLLDNYHRRLGEYRITSMPASEIFSSDEYLSVAITSGSLSERRTAMLVSFAPRISSLFVTIGILGTFVGLTAGVYELRSGLDQDVMARISGLLSGLYLAFITSIIGLVSSMIASRMVVHPGMERFEAAIAAIARELDLTHRRDAPDQTVLLLEAIDSKLLPAIRSVGDGVERIAGIDRDGIQMIIEVSMESLRLEIINLTQEIKAEVMRQLEHEISAAANSARDASHMLASVATHLSPTLAALEDATRNATDSMASMHDVLSGRDLLTKELSEVTEALKAAHQAITQATNQFGETSSETSERVAMILTDIQHAATSLEHALRSTGTLGENLEEILQGFIDQASYAANVISGTTSRSPMQRKSK